MRKIWLIIKREYLTRVRKRSFLLLTFLTPLGFILLITVPILLASLSDETRHVAVIDKSELLSTYIEDKSTMKFSYVDLPLHKMKQEYKEKGYDGVLYIPELKLDERPEVFYYSHKQMGMAIETYIEKTIEEDLEMLRMEKAGIKKEAMRQIEVKLSLQNIMISEEGEKKTSSAVATALGYFMGILIYIILFMYGTMVMKSVAEEKHSRIVEIIISSVRPFQLMIGKIVGVAGVGLTQFILWAGMVFILQLIFGMILGGELQTAREVPGMGAAGGPSEAEIMEQTLLILEAVQEINFVELTLVFAFYFLGGYLLYAALFAAIGSAAGDEGDNQSMVAIATIPIMISFFIMITIINQPHSQLAVWASIIPFSSPLVMPARVPFGIPAWQLILSMVMLIGGFIFTTWLAAKIYRVGILMYGKKISIKEVTRWIFYKQ